MVSVRSELKAMSHSPNKKVISQSVREQIKANRSNSFKIGRVTEWVVPKLLFVCASLSILVTFGIIYTLLKETVTFFGQVSIIEFVTGTQWTPLFQPQRFGVLPLVAGSVLVALIASIVAIPIGLASAIFLSEYAPDRVRRVIKPILEVLAGVPTIVYGFFALSFVTPLLRVFIPDLGLFNALSAGIVVGIMIIPMVASLSEDAMTAVPRSIREGAYALGATRLEVALKVVVPAAFSGIIASFVLAISRAIGETMIVTIAAGAMPNFTFNPVEPVQTLTAYIVQVSLGDTPFGSIEYYTIYAVGMTLFVLTFVMNIIASWLSRRFKEDY
ncbi:phosphate ABC transporter, inner membrane subunit PstC [Caldalkalibacillus thermarum TA2.A1]|uniref:Phosphate transport system permease protein n=2 Tax=Caldalkalibacillus thermarum (strain TA2.A1) TaxID=986075 RepID=F5L7P7_CALTT|nr:phosphate ABC transporter permease subunit PstC [Caldalkalibacillus thermarum]EGL82623.1 phosphate ABC transporter, inner membrane subunit PstC [Caldalkalibacillus thermarum TA2.A1]